MRLFMRPRRAAIATKFTIRPHTHSRRDPCRVLSLLGLVPNWGKEEGLLQQFMIESHNHSTEPVLCYYCCDKKHNGRAGELLVPNRRLQYYLGQNLRFRRNYIKLFLFIRNSCISHYIQPSFHSSTVGYYANGMVIVKMAKPWNTCCFLHMNNLG